MEHRAQINHDRLSVLLGGAAVGLTMSRVMQLPAQQFGVSVFGTPLGVKLTGDWWMTLLVAGLVVAGAQAVYLDHPSRVGRQLYRTAVFWILPGLTTLASGAVLNQMESIRLWMPALAAALLLLGMVTVNEYQALDAAAAERPRVQLLSSSWVYGLTLALLMLIYAARLRALLLAPAAWVLGSLLALRFLWTTGQTPRRLLLYAGVVGLGMGQLAWALNYWQLEPLAGGLALLAAFYLLAGIAQQALMDRLTKQTWIEYGIVALIAGTAVVLLSF